MCSKCSNDVVDATIHNCMGKLNKICEIPYDHWDCQDIDNVKDLLTAIDMALDIKKHISERPVEIHPKEWGVK